MPQEIDSQTKASEGAQVRPRFAVLISGSGRTLENLVTVIARGELEGEVAVVVSSKQNVRGISVAQSAGIPALVIDRRDFSEDLEFSNQLFHLLTPFDPHLILLAGFLRKIYVSDRWKDRILNIHPALLPEMASASGRGFYGDRVHAEVLRSGAERSGATVHLVDNDYDTGTVISTIEVPVLEGDTVDSLASRVFAAECRLYPAAIASYLEQHRDWLMHAPGVRPIPESR